MSKVGKSTLIARLNWAHEPGQEKRIDLWWGGLENNGDMMLMLAYLLSLNPEWSDARIVIRSIARSEDEMKLQRDGLQSLLQEIRIGAETEIITKPPNASIAEVIRSGSANADLVFLGLQNPPPVSEAAYAKRMEALTDGLKTTVFVHNAGEFAGKLV